MIKNLLLAAAIGAFAFAIGFVVLSAWQSSQPQDRPANDKTGAEGSAQESRQPTTMVSPKETSDAAIARYNRWIMIFTGALALVAMLQIAFLIDANRVAGNAARAAQQSADATKDAVFGAERNAQRQLRAYLHFKEMVITPVKDASGQDVFVFEPVFKNFGNTPAHIRRVIVSTRVVTDGNVDALTWPDTLEGAEQSIYMAPSLDGKVAELEVHLKDAQRLGEEYRLIYRFYVEYLTVFPELGARKTAQVVEISARGDPVQALGPSGVKPSQLFRFVAISKGSFAD